MQSSRGCSFQSLPIPKLLQVGSDGCIEFCSFCGLVAESCGEPCHLVYEWLTIVCNILGSDITTRREHVTVFPDFGDKYLSTNLWIGWEQWRKERLQKLVSKWNASASATT